MGDVAQWLDDLGLGRYAEAFAENAIDWDVLPDLTDRDLETLGVLLGHRKKLLKAISGLASGVETVAPKGPSAATEAERQQIGSYIATGGTTD